MTNSFKKFVRSCLRVALLTASSSAFAGQMTRDATGITIETQTGLTRVEIWNDRVVRVLHSPEKKLPPISSLAVVAKPAHVEWKLKDERDDAMLETPALRVRVDKASGSVEFLDSEGSRLLDESTGGAS